MKSQMADHRVNDLSYGHLGEATYDIDEHKWTFSRSENRGILINLLHPLRECIPAALKPPLGSSKRVSQTWHDQNQWLSRSTPEAGPASGILSVLNRQARKAVSNPSPSTLMGVGFALNTDHLSGTRKVQILAVASGEAGNLLRLIKPRVEGLGWEGHNGVNLRVLNFDAAEECYWLGEIGPIKQVGFGTDTNGITSWLTVRRAESTSFLRPVLRRLPVPSTLPADFAKRPPPSRLCPNPILTLKSERTGGRPHSDVAFNPWYIKQFAIVDQEGYWSIWDIEGQTQRRITVDAVPGKFGHIHKDRFPEPSTKSTNTTDGWGRVLWAGSVSTLVVCDRRSVAVFSLKGQPKRLSCPDTIDTRSTDWILDVKRSMIRLDEIFVLTTTRIFWIQINPMGEESDHVGAKILLSCRHFRDREDDTMRLEVLLEDDVCLVFLYSGRNELIKTYQFLFSPGGTGTATCVSDSFKALGDNSRPVDCGAMQTMCMIPTMFIQNPSKLYSGPGKDYIERDARFYQLLAVDKHLSMSHALCSIQFLFSKSMAGTLDVNHDVQLPTKKSGRGMNVLSSAIVVEDKFIVPDGIEEDDGLCQLTNSPKHIRGKSVDNLALTINASSMFRVAFNDIKGDHPTVLLQKSQSVSAFVENLLEEIEKRMAHGPQVFAPLFEFVDYAPFADDIDDVSSMFNDMILALGNTEVDEKYLNSTIGLINAFSIIEKQSPDNEHPEMSTLSSTYDKLVDLWVSHLPHNIPGSARLAKERLVRNIATQLYLSSVMLSIRDKSVNIPESWQPSEPTTMDLPVRERGGLRSTQKHLSEEPSSMETRLGSSVPILGLQTPDPTPSIASRSRETSTIAEELKEDESIARLRGYALSVRSQQPLNASRASILAQWPANPGADPFKYIWKDNRKHAEDYEELASDEEEDYKRRKEEERRKRREERFLKTERVDTIGGASQHSAIATGSQLDPIQHFDSSQPIVPEISMTQPNRGAFGSRLAQKSSKKRRIRGF